MPQSRERHREYMREYRRRKKAAQSAPAGPTRPNLATVHPMPGPDQPSPPRPPGDAEPATVEDAVRAELDALPAATARPGLAAAALALARLLDDLDSRPHHASAAGRLATILTELRGAARTTPGKASKLSRLAALQTGQP